MIAPHRAELVSRTEVLNDGWLSTIIMCRVCGEHVLTFRSPLGENHSPTLSGTGRGAAPVQTRPATKARP